MLRNLLWLSVAVGITCAALPTLALAQEVELLENGGFDTDLSGWFLPQPSTYTFSWQMDDVDGDQASGSAHWEAANSTGGRAIQQCVNVAPGPISVSAWTLVPTGQTDAPTPRLLAGIYTESDCAGGSRTGISQTDPVLVEGTWTLMEAELIAGANVRSANIELIFGLNVDPAEPSVAFFDAASLVPEPGSVPMSAAALLVIASLAFRRRG